jgi:hypothetical protein
MMHLLMPDISNVHIASDDRVLQLQVWVSQR